MKLATVWHHNEPRLGAWIDKNSQRYFLDRHHAQLSLPSDFLAFLQADGRAMQAAQQIVAHSASSALKSRHMRTPGVQFLHLDISHLGAR